MNYVALLHPTTRVINSATVTKDRQQIYSSAYTSNLEKNEPERIKNVSYWHEQDRRSGIDRRENNDTRHAKLEARNKTNRRSNRLNIQI